MLLKDDEMDVIEHLGSRKGSARARNLTTISNWLQSRQSRQADAMLVSGPPGMGKSLLTAQSFLIAGKLEWLTLSVAGSDFGAEPLLAVEPSTAPGSGESTTGSGSEGGQRYARLPGAHNAPVGE